MKRLRLKKRNRLRLNAPPIMPNTIIFDYDSIGKRSLSGDNWTCNVVASRTEEKLYTDPNALEDRMRGVFPSKKAFVRSLRDNWGDRVKMLGRNRDSVLIGVPKDIMPHVIRHVANLAISYRVIGPNRIMLYIPTIRFKVHGGE
ncbi:MAG: hypothetical protein PHG87_07280 [Candidatus Omnitrophica bacterium]|nr:hypothetical protein [Candidatus Omnitrophota bacterium]